MAGSRSFTPLAAAGMIGTGFVGSAFPKKMRGRIWCIPPAPVQNPHAYDALDPDPLYMIEHLCAPDQQLPADVLVPHTADECRTT